VGGDHDHRRRNAPAYDPFQHRLTAHARQFQVQDDRVEGLLLKALNRRLPGLNPFGIDVFKAEILFQRFPYVPFIIYD
jgi:hypothetical protein